MNMKAILELLDQVIQAIEDWEPGQDRDAWLTREALEYLDKVRGMLAAIVEDEEGGEK